MKQIITFLLIFFTLTIISQNGEITYSIKMDKNNTISKKIDSTNANPTSASMDVLMGALKKSISNFDDVEFKLTFNDNESHYAYIEAMDTENSELPNMLRNMIIESGRKYNYNYKTKIISKQSEFEGEKYIIKSHSDSLKWKFENDKKTINGYKCNKATTVKYKKYPSGIKEIPVTAWYSLDLLIPIGPGRYNGLPGLIIELQEGDKILFIKKIIFSKTVKKIKKLKGKIVTEEEFEKIWRWSLND